MQKLSEKWQKAIVWLTGYLNIIAFFLAGGYIYLKTDNEDVKTSAKNVLVLLIGFTGLDILRSVIYNILSIASASYDVLNAISKIGTVFTIIKAIVFVVLFILDICGKKIMLVKQSKIVETKSEEKDESISE